MKVAPLIVVSALAVCVLFGVCSQELLMSRDIGFNLAVMSLLFLGSILILKAKRMIDADFKMAYLVVPTLVAVFGYSVPDSRGLDQLNTCMLLLSIGYCALRSACERPLTLVESVGKVPPLLMVIPMAGFMLASLGDWKQMPKFGKLNIGRGALIGCIAAIPFLAVFGNILAQADPVFAKIFSFNFNIDPEAFVIRTFAFVFSASFLAGVLIYCSKAMFERLNVALALQPTSVPPPIQGYGPPLTPVEPKTASSRESEHAATFVTFFGLIASMFLVFVLVQLRYLFGGDSVVLSTEHLTYAQYARRGFFEITGVAAICLPLVIFSQYALRNFDSKVRKAINIVVVVIVSLLMLLLASAAFRLKLYVGAYGLTPLRVYVASGMLWLLILFGAYLRYGTQWKLDKIGKVVYAGMVAITMGLNIVRPDYWIARVNLTRRESKDIDPNMITDAGADAQSAIQQFGKGKVAVPEVKVDFLTLFNQKQNARSHNWKDLTISQLMMAKN